MAMAHDLTRPSAESLRQELGFADSVYDHFWLHYGHCQKWMHRHFIVLKEISSEAPSTSKHEGFEIDSDSEEENDEISPELLEFMRISQDHRKERERQKLEEEMKGKSTSKTWFADDQDVYEMADKGIPRITFFEMCHLNLKFL